MPKVPLADLAKQEGTCLISRGRELRMTPLLQYLQYSKSLEQCHVLSKLIHIIFIYAEDPYGRKHD